MYILDINILIGKESKERKIANFKRLISNVKRGRVAARIDGSLRELHDAKKRHPRVCVRRSDQGFHEKNSVYVKQLGIRCAARGGGVRSE